jgi:hypothetical protein
MFHSLEVFYQLISATALEPLDFHPRSQFLWKVVLLMLGPQILEVPQNLTVPTNSLAYLHTRTRKQDILCCIWHACFLCRRRVRICIANSLRTWHSPWLQLPGACSDGCTQFARLYPACFVKWWIDFQVIREIISCACWSDRDFLGILSFNDVLPGNLGLVRICLGFFFCFEIASWAAVAVALKVLSGSRAPGFFLMMLSKWRSSRK